MLRFIKAFIREDNGAVTVDWVVLTALVVTLLGAGYGALETATTGVSSNTEQYMTNWTF